MTTLTKGNEAKVILSFAIPMVLGNLLQQLYNVADSIIVGNALGKEALAAVGASFPVFYALIAFIIGIGSGASVIIAQYFGAEQFKNVKETISTIFIVLFIASIVITPIAIIYSGDIMSLLNVDKTVLPQAKDYFSTYMIGSIAFFGFNGTSSILRGIGDSRTPLYFMILSTVLNIALDLMFVLVFKWGIKGAAMATVVSQFISFAGVIYHLNKKKHIISFNLKEWVFNNKIFKQIIRIGLPTALQQTFVALGLLALIRIVNNFEPAVLTAYTAAGRIDSLASLPAMNLASALSTFVGQNLGAGKEDRIKRGFKATLLMSSLISIVVMIIAYFFSEPLIRMFNSDPDVVRYGSSYLIIVSSFYLIFSTMFILHGLLRGAGATLVPMFLSLLSLWLVRVPLAMIFSEKWGVDGIWWSIPAGWSVGMIGSLIYYASNKWKNKSVIKQHPVKEHDK